MLVSLGYDNIDDENLESMFKILYDDYNIKIVPVLTISELARKLLESTANNVITLERDIKNILPNKQQNFSREQLKHFNRLQNTRFKIVNQRHR